MSRLKIFHRGIYVDKAILLRDAKVICDRNDVIVVSHSSTQITLPLAPLYFPQFVIT